MARLIEEIIYEYWDCPKCGTREIRGDNYVCPSCGYRRDETITFYRKSEEEKVVEKDKENEFLHGPDWVCSFCESLNKNKQEDCSACGATKESSKKNYLQELEKRKNDEKLISPKATEKKGFPVWVYYLGGFLSLLIIFITYGTCSKPVGYVVEEVNWIRAIEQNRYSWVNREDWKDEMQGDEPQIYRESEEIRRYEKRQIGTKTETYHETEQYQSGTREECSTSYESTGSGASKKITKCDDVPVYSSRSVTRTREVPVFKDFPITGIKVYYKSKMYISIGYKVNNGKDNNPIWPQIVGKGEDEKPDIEGNRREFLVIQIRKSDATSTGPEVEKILVDEKLFREIYKKDNKINMEVMNFGGFHYPAGLEKLDEESYNTELDEIFKRKLL